MADPDRNAVLAAKRALTIIFIIMITLTNISLLFKIIRIPKCLYKPKCLTLISLAIGDILLALFPLVIMALLAFEGDLSLSCSTIVSGNVYLTYLLTFVYGVGLIVLTVELTIRKRNPTATTTATSSVQIVKSFVISAVPWILGLIIILPLTMAGMDWDQCDFPFYSDLDRARAVWVISVIIPACLALLMTIFVMCSSPTYAQPQYLPTSAVLCSPPTSQNPQHPQELQFSNPLAELNSYPQPPVNGCHNMQNTKHFHPPPQNFQVTSNPHTPPPVDPYNNPQTNLYNPQPNTSQPNPHTLAPTVSSSPNIDHSREKNTLLGVSIVYFICVVPLAGYSLHFLSPDSTSDLDRLGLTVVSMVVQWVSILRSFITPIIWIQSSGLRVI